jgi:MFS superfamily sulfate permease-like transporter
MVSGSAGAMAVVSVVVMDPSGLFSEKWLLERGDIQPGWGENEFVKDSSFNTPPRHCDGERICSLFWQAKDKRLEYLCLVMMLVGALQIVLGVCQFGRLVKLIPTTVMTGFVNGLATIIFLAQLETFQEPDWQKSFNYFDGCMNGTVKDGIIDPEEVRTRFSADLAGLSEAGIATEVNEIFSEVNGNSTTFNGVDFGEFKLDKTHRIHTGHPEYKMWRTLDQGVTWMMLLYVFGSMLVIWLYPKIPKIGKLVPSPLVSIIFCFIFEYGISRPAFDIQSPTVGDMASVQGDLPRFHVPDVNIDGEVLGIIFPTIISLALVGIIESVLTLQLVDEILEDTSDPTGRCTQECLAQGVANLVASAFQGALGGDAMIGQSTINVQSGGIGRLSTTFASLMFLAFILALSSVIEAMPIAALTGILFMVVINTFDWSCLGLMSGVDMRLTFGCGEVRKDKVEPEEQEPPVSAAVASLRTTNGRARVQDSALIVLVTVVTVWTDLAIAVILGVIVAALLYAWESSADLEVEVETAPDNQTKTYTALGPLFFSSDRAFKNYFTISADPPTVIIDLRLCTMRDYSALAAVNAIGLRYSSLKKTCVVKVGGEGNLRLLRLFGRRLQNVRLEVETIEGKES